MKKLIIIIIFVSVLTACRSGLDIVDNRYVQVRSGMTKSFSMTDFEVYVFDLCEEIVETKNTAVNKQKLLTRFCDCPADFYDVSKEKNIQKVEEIYMLKHKTTHLVLYLTTFSHKYITQEKGFLNDRDIYENKIVLNEVEEIFVGSMDEATHEIYFKGKEDKDDVTFYFDPEAYPEKILVTKGKMTTAENGYNNMETIVLSGVFRKDIKYVLKPSYAIDYYENNSHKNDAVAREPAKQVSKVQIVQDDDAMEVIFSFSDFEKHYKFASKRIRFYPNFSAIPNGK